MMVGLVEQKKKKKDVMLVCHYHQLLHLRKECCCFWCRRSSCSMCVIGMWSGSLGTGKVRLWRGIGIKYI